MATIICRVGAEVLGDQPPAVDPGHWVQVYEFFLAEGRSRWALRGESLLQEGALKDGAEAIARNAFGADRLISASVQRCDGRPLPGAAEKTRAFLAQRGELDAIEGKI